MAAPELVIEGAGAGIAGVGAMTALDTLEQRLTGRGVGLADLIARGPGERGPG